MVHDVCNKVKNRCLLDSLEISKSSKNLDCYDVIKRDIVEQFVT